MSISTVSICLLLTFHFITFELYHNYNLFQALRQVYKSKSNIVILDCSKEILVEVLKEAQQVSIVSETYFYLLTSLDSHTVDLEPFTVGH